MVGKKCVKDILTKTKSFILVVPSPSARRRILFGGVTAVYIRNALRPTPRRTPQRSAPRAPLLPPTAFARSFHSQVILAEPWHLKEDAHGSWSAVTKAVGLVGTVAPHFHIDVLTAKKVTKYYFSIG